MAAAQGLRQGLQWPRSHCTPPPAPDVSPLEAGAGGGLRRGPRAKGVSRLFGRFGTQFPEVHNVSSLVIATDGSAIQAHPSINLI